MEEQASSARPSKGTNQAASLTASKSAHVIDLRQSGGRPAAAPVVKPSRPPKKTPAAPTRKVAPATTSYNQVAAPASGAYRKPVATASQSEAVPADFFDAPPTRRRFWPAFWRFLLLLVVLGLLICGGVFLYLKFYNP